MGNLPSVFQNKVNNLKSNDQESFYSSNRNNFNNLKKINIDEIFKGSSYIYKRKVELLFLNGNMEEKIIVSRNGDYLITIDNEKIRIGDVKEIYIK